MQRSTLSKLGRYFAGSGLVCSIGSFFITYEGLLTISGNPLFCLMLTAASWVVSMMILHVCCQVIPRATADARPKLLAGVAGPGMLFIVLSSTSMAVLGMAAPEAQRLDMRQTLDRAELRLEQAQITQQQQANAITLLRSQAQQLEASSEQESVTGTLLDKGRRSRSVQDLHALSEAYALAAGQVKSDHERRVEAAGNANRILGELRAIVDDAQANAQDLRAVDQRYLEHLRELNVALADLERSALEDNVLAPVAQVLAARRDTPLKALKTRRARQPESGDAPEGRRQGRSQRSRAQGERQEKREAALATLHARNEQVLEENQAALQDLLAEPGPSQRLERRSPMQAVWAHRAAVAHLIAFPFILDLAIPIIALMTLSILGSMQAPPIPVPPTVSLPESSPHATPSARMRLAQVTAIARPQGRLGQGHQDREGPAS